MKLYPILMLMEAIGSSQRLTNKRDDDIEQFLANEMHSLPEDVVIRKGKRMFGERWPYEFKSQLYLYCFSRNSRPPFDSEYETIRRLLDTHEQELCELYIKDINLPLSHHIRSMMDFLHDKENYIASSDVKKDCLKALITGWIRYTCNKEAIATTSHPSIISQIQLNMDMNQAKSTAKQLSELYGFEITEYHIQHIIGELKGDRSVDDKWWREELSTPWMLSVIKQSAIINNISAIHDRYCQIFKDRVMYVRKTSFRTKMHSLMKTMQSEKTMVTNQAGVTTNAFMEDNKEKILSIINNPSLSLQQKSEMLNLEFPDSPIKIDRHVVSKLITKYTTHTLSQFPSRKISSNHLQLLSIADEIKDKLKHNTVVDVLQWLEAEKGIKTSRSSLTTLGLHTPSPTSPWRQQLFPHLNQIKQMLDGGKSYEYICRWLSHNLNLEVQPKDLGLFLNNYRADRDIKEKRHNNGATD